MVWLSSSMARLPREHIDRKASPIGSPPNEAASP